MAQDFLDGATLEGSGTGGNDVRKRFEREVAPLRPELHAHCYRMLGSVFDADDALQDGLVRAWRAFERFEGRSSIRTWLYTIVTRSCLDAAAARGERALPVDLGPAASRLVRDSVPHAELRWLTPSPDPADAAERSERVELALIATLQHLSGNERAAFLLVDVLGFSAVETAEVLAATPTAVHSALSRARRSLAGGAHEKGAISAPSETTVSLARRFAEALASSDLDAFVALLAPDVTWQMPPLREWYSGIEAVTRFAHAVPMTLCPSWRTKVLTANGQPAVAFYVGESDDAPHHAWSLTVLTVGDPGITGRQGITGIVSFLDPALFPRFDLPLAVG